MRIAQRIALLIISCACVQANAQIEYSDVVYQEPQESCFDGSCFAPAQPARPRLIASVDILILDRHDALSGAYFFDNVTFQPLLNIGRSIT